MEVGRGGARIAAVADEAQDLPRLNLAARRQPRRPAVEVGVVGERRALADDPHDLAAEAVGADPHHHAADGADHRGAAGGEDVDAVVAAAPRARRAPAAAQVGGPDPRDRHGVAGGTRQVGEREQQPRVHRRHEGEGGQQRGDADRGGEDEQAGEGATGSRHPLRRCRTRASRRTAARPGARCGVRAGGHARGGVTRRPGGPAPHPGPARSSAPPRGARAPRRAGASRAAAPRPAASAGRGRAPSGRRRGPSG